jgi:anti-sigma-K factor RskA
MKHEDYKEMIPARALSALDAADDRVLSEHLLQCVDCSRELDDWQATVVGLAVSADPSEPSTQLRERILAQVRNEVRTAVNSNVVPFAPPQRNLWSSFGSLGAIAALLVFAALLVYVVLLWQENRANVNRMALMNKEIQELRSAQDEQSKLKAIELIEMFEAPGTHIAELKATKMAPGAIAKIAYDPTGHAMLITGGLPVLPKDKQYQLWFIVPNKSPMPSKAFSTDVKGRGMVEVEVPAVAMDSGVFAITLEPMGGGSAPTGEIYLRSGI